MEDHLAGKDRSVVYLYEGFVRLVAACGPFEYSIAKTAITFKGSRRGFASAIPTNRASTAISTYSGESRLTLISAGPRRTPGDCSYISSGSHPSDQLDDEFAGWVREAYAVGQGAHLLDAPPTKHRSI